MTGGNVAQHETTDDTRDRDGKPLCAVDEVNLLMKAGGRSSPALDLRSSEAQEVSP